MYDISTTQYLTLIQYLASPPSLMQWSAINFLSWWAWSPSSPATGPLTSVFLQSILRISLTVPNPPLPNTRPIVNSSIANLGITSCASTEKSWESFSMDATLAVAILVIILSVSGEWDEEADLLELAARCSAAAWAARAALDTMIRCW